MKILFITAFPPNNNTAGQNYTRLLLEELSKNHEIDLIYWTLPHHDVLLPNNIRIIKKYTVSKHTLNILKLLTYFPLFSKRFTTDARKTIQNIHSNYNIIYFDFSQVMIYSKYINHPYKIGMSHDVIGQKFSRNKIGKFFGGWIRFSEKNILKSMNLILSFSNKDKDFILREYNLKSEVVSFYIAPEILRIDLKTQSLQNYFVMFGAWKRSENQESIKWLLNANISSNVKIIGGGMPDDLLRQINNRSNLEYVGFIDNPYSIIASSRGLIAPLWHGAGVKVKAIESLALGTPVFGTDVTFEGIDLNDDLAKKCFININNSNCIQDIDDYYISLSDKLDIQSSFLRTYGNNKFSSRLSKMIIPTI